MTTTSPGSAGDAGAAKVGTEAPESPLRHEFRSLIADIEDFLGSSGIAVGGDFDAARAELGARLASARGALEAAGKEATAQAQSISQAA
ncbi:MAG TPA: DUF883 family protein, partial [Nevskiaceae bacterium]